jgi:hypothetical protein
VSTPAASTPAVSTPASYLSGIPLAVVPVHDGSSDAVSDELRASVSAALARQAGIHVVDPQRVAEVMAYHEPSASGAAASRQLAHALELQQRAKEHFLNFASAEALAEMRSALQAIQSAPLSLHDKGQVLRDALVTTAVIAADTKDMALATQYFESALRIDPQYQLDGGNFSPRLKENFAKVRAQVVRAATGSVQVQSDPKVADVYINGVKKGVTPLQVALPAGDYEVRVAGNRYTAFEKKIQIQSGESTTVDAHLTWQRAKPKPSATSVETSETQALIREGQRLMDLLRLQKVVLLDVDAAPDGSGEVRARMMDATTKASHRPVVVRYCADRSSLPQDMGEMVKLLTAQATLKRIDNPVAQLDPVGVGDPIVLGRRKGRGISPLGWGVIGGVAGAGALGGILAAVLSGGGGGGSASSGIGSVHVQLSK